MLVYCNGFYLSGLLHSVDKCSGLVHWEDPEGLGREGGGRGDQDGEYSKSMADSCQCMTKTTTIL